MQNFGGYIVVNSPPTKRLYYRKEALKGYCERVEAQSTLLDSYGADGQSYDVANRRKSVGPIPPSSVDAQYNHHLYIIIVTGG